LTGCEKASPGCKFCYSEREWVRLSANPKTVYFGRKFTDVMCHPERLDQPLRWTRARKIFVNSMSDLFHDAVPVEFIDQVFAVMALAPRHTFQILTKRPARMRDYMIRITQEPEHLDAAARTLGHVLSFDGLPLPNVWLGGSVENQETANERIPILLRTPAAVRWISAEPLIGPLGLIHVALAGTTFNALAKRTGQNTIPGLDWVVVGGESGPLLKSRPMLPIWARNLTDQCDSAGVPVFYKQEGSWLHIQSVEDSGAFPANKLHYFPHIDATFIHRKGGGAETLDGQTYQHFPIDA
jgi:protein gp37